MTCETHLWTHVRTHMVFLNSLDLFYKCDS